MTEAEWLTALQVTDAKVLVGVSSPPRRSKQAPRPVVSVRVTTAWGSGFGDGASVREAIVAAFRDIYREADRLARQEPIRSIYHPDVPSDVDDRHVAYAAAAKSMRAAWHAAGEEGEP